MTSVAIIDYGVGNLRSVEKAFATAAHSVVVSNDPGVLREAKALVLPGVGAFAACMRELSKRNFDRLVVDQVAQGVPLLGVCVGMQMLFDESEEFGKTAGLGLVKGYVRRFDEGLRIPHIGWNQVQQKKDSPLLADIDDNEFFYFLHSYFCVVEDQERELGETDYGQRYCSIVSNGNLFGVQFHPEKSQRSGLKLLDNFARLALDR